MSNVTDESTIDQLFHLAPGLHVVLVDVRHCILEARRNITTRRMMIWEGPVN